MPLILATLLLAAAPAAPTPEQQLATDINSFAVSFDRKIASKNEDFAWSPLSLSMLLGILEAGTNGMTAREIRRTAHFGSAGDELRRAFQLMGRSLRGRASLTFGLGSAVWANSNVRIKPAFAKTAQARYGAAVRTVDFVDATAEAIRTINEWAGRATHGKITQLVSGNSVSSDTRLVLTTAVYFREKWQEQFDPSKTRPASFAAPGHPVQVQMMSRLVTVRYAESESYQIVELPYASGHFAMIVYLPKSAEKRATLDDLVKAAKALQEQRVLVELPRFRVAGDLSLADALKRSGMRRVFSPDADFSRLTTTRGLSLSAVLQKAIVEVSEEGTEATAATAGIIGITSVEVPAVFRADRPFVFAICDSENGLILFAGSVVDPSS